MEVAARQHLARFGEYKRVVGSAVDLNLKYLLRMSNRTAGRAVHLGHATNGVGVLNPGIDSVVPVGFADLAALHQHSQPRGTSDLALMRANALNSLIECDRSSPEGLERHHSGDICRV